MLTYVHLDVSPFLTSRFGLPDHLLLRSSRPGFAGLEDIIGQVEAEMCEKSNHLTRNAGVSETYLRTWVTARS
jgi:hypothetical protein